MVKEITAHATNAARAMAAVVCRMSDEPKTIRLDSLVETSNQLSTHRPTTHPTPTSASHSHVSAIRPHTGKGSALLVPVPENKRYNTNLSICEPCSPRAASPTATASGPR